MLHEKNIRKLCHSIPKLVYDEFGLIDTPAHIRACDISKRFKELMDNYGVCHRLMNSSDYFNDEKIQQLDTAIKKFFVHYRDNFKQSITIKLHMLECHILKFIKKWRIGLGMYGEQGAESIHPEFNSLRKTYASHKPAEKRLQTMVEQHLLRVAPEVRVTVPKPPTRKRKHKPEE
ncbi:uncharacterized protein [Clytia hemisphaerica]